jgi:hypothetical protein
MRSTIPGIPFLLKPNARVKHQFASNPRDSFTFGTGARVKGVVVRFFLEKRVHNFISTDNDKIIKAPAEQDIEYMHKRGRKTEA